MSPLDATQPLPAGLSAIPDLLFDWGSIGIATGGTSPSGPCPGWFAYYTCTTLEPGGQKGVTMFRAIIDHVVDDPACENYAFEARRALMKFKWASVDMPYLGRHFGEHHTDAGIWHYGIYDDHPGFSDPNEQWVLARTMMHEAIHHLRPDLNARDEACRCTTGCMNPWSMMEQVQLP